MQLTLRDGLILTRVTVAYQGQEVEVPDIVVDTGVAVFVQTKPRRRSEGGFQTKSSA